MGLINMLRTASTIRAVRSSYMMSFRKLLTSLLALTTLVLVACQSAATPTPIPVKLTPIPTVGGELILLGDDPPTLDPHKSSDATSASIIVEVFGGLVTLDRELKVRPDLAERWVQNTDGRDYTFYLRKNARFHNGRAVTAQDVKWSFERATDPATDSDTASQYLNDIEGFAAKALGMAKEISGIRIIDEATVQISTDAPKSYFLSKLTHPVAFVVDRETVTSNPNWTSKPNGTGPFKIEEYSPRSQLVLERNRSYHLGAPYLESVKLLLSGGSAMLMYENEELHIIGIGAADVERITDPKSQLRSQLRAVPGGFNTTYIGLNASEPPFDDVRVRQALNYALDRRHIAQSVMSNSVVLANGVLPPGFPGYNPNLRGYEYDPAKAKTLFAESRYGNSAFPDVTLTIPGSFGQPLSGEVYAMVTMWHDVLGINIKVERTPFETFLQELRRERLQMSHLGWIADYPDPENFLDNLFHSGSGNNHTAYHNIELDSLLEMARVARDEQARMELYHRAEEIIVADAPWVFLWHPGRSYILVKPYVYGYEPAPIIIPILRYVHMAR
jgi:ABC-type transport system substrate-binding protein